jgi:hypothetical protein
MIQYADLLVSETKSIGLCFPDTPNLNFLTVYSHYYFENAVMTHAKQWTLFIVNFIILPGCLLVNIQSFRALRSKRNQSSQTQKTVDKHSWSLLRICIIEVLINFVNTFVDVGFFNIILKRV